MSKSHISAKLRQQVAEQSRDMCCYCQSQQRLIGISDKCWVTLFRYAQ